MKNYFKVSTIVLILVFVASQLTINVAKAQTKAVASAKKTITTDELLNKAKKNKQAVYLLITEKGVKDQNAVSIANQAQKLTKNSTIVTLFRDDKTNEALVKKYGLQGAPLPLIIVIASNGVLAGGYVVDGKVMAKDFAALIPSPKKEAIMNAIDKKNAVFVLVSKKGFSDKANVLKNCKAAIALLKNKAVVIEIDLTDKKEAEFLKQMGVDIANQNATATVVINSLGQVIANYKGATEPAKLVKSANEVKKGCGPSCAPGKKC